MTVELDRGAGLTLWRQIAEQFRQEILSGAREPGARLPPEGVLAASLAVNRHTVRRALAALQAEGLVRVEQGRGTFVQESMVDYHLGRRTRFSENITAQNRSPGGRLIRAEELAAGVVVARALKIEPQDRVLFLETLYEADGQPLSLAAHYFPKARVPNLVEEFKRTGSITQALARSGVADYWRKESRITARIGRAADLALLHQAPDRPVLLIEAVNVDAQGVPIEYSVTRWASERVQIVVEPGQL